MMTEGRPQFRWPFVLVLLAVCLVVIVFRVMHSVDQAQDHVARGARGVAETVADTASRFKSGTITTTFTSTLPQLIVDGGVKLELAAYEEVVEFSNEDSFSVFWDLIPLGTTTTEIRVPTTFRYHLLLSDPWNIEVRDSSCIVHAPRIRPTLPPAIDLSRLERRADRGWARFNVDDQMRDLELNMTNRLKIQAADSRHIDLVREECRMRVAEFVRSWLLREEQWQDGRFTSVVVVFADEESISDEEPTPTLRFTDLN